MNEVENEVEKTATQDSPSVEQNTPEQSDLSDQQPEEVGGASEPPQERNWKALREENERLKAQLQDKEEVRPEELNPFDVIAGDGVTSSFLTQNDTLNLRLDEHKASLAFPELDNDSMFADAVAGKYRAALDQYTQSLLNGVPAKLPSAYAITKQFKAQWDKRFGTVTKQAQVEGAKKAKESVESREATLEAEGTSGRTRNAREASELGQLRRMSREGSLDAIAERLSRSGI